MAKDQKMKATPATPATEQAKAEAIEKALGDVVRWGEALEHMSHTVHTASSTGSHDVRPRIERRYLAAIASLGGLLAEADAAEEAAKAGAETAAG